MAVHVYGRGLAYAHIAELSLHSLSAQGLETEMSTDPKVTELRERDADYGASYVMPRLHDEAIIKQTSSKHRAIRAHVVHMYFKCICWMFAR